MSIRFCRSCGTRLSEPVGRFCQSCGVEVDSAAGLTPGEVPASPGESPARGRSRSWLVAIIVFAALVVVGAVMLARGGGSSQSSNEDGITTLPSPTEMPPRTVALVSHLGRRSHPVLAE
jgi:hypothetical protein